METKFITDNKGKKLSVILPIKECLRLLEESEELADIQLYDEVKSRNEKTTSLEKYIKQRKKVYK